MPEVFVNGLADNARKDLIDVLNARLKDTVALTLAVKQAHWNLKGRGFIGVHELLDDVAAHLRDAADLMAERAVILGGIAVGTAPEVARESKIEPYPDDIIAIEDHVSALTQRFMSYSKLLRDAIERSEDAGDPGCEDLFTEVLRAAEKDAWFIGANAEASATA